MCVLQRLARSRSSSSASQKTLPPRSVWRRLNTAWDGTVLLLLGQVCFSEWSLMAFFPGFSSMLLIFCPFRSPSLWFCHLSRAQRPVLNDFRSSDQDELFHNLVAQFVGCARGCSSVAWAQTRATQESTAGSAAYRQGDHRCSTRRGLAEHHLARKQQLSPQQTVSCRHGVCSSQPDARA